MMAAEMIQRQDHLTGLGKRARELADKLKYDTRFLAELKKGESNNGYPFDAPFIAYNLPRMTAEFEKHTAAKAEVDAKIAAVERAPVASLPHKELLAFFKGTGADGARNGLELLALCLENGNWVPGASRRIKSVLDPTKAASKSREAYKLEFAKLAALFSKWDATRPAPTFTTDEGASATVTATLKELKAVGVSVCPMKYEEFEYLDGNGKKAYRTIVHLLWPEGTKHGTSRYSETRDNRQCQACGHAIKNAFNWIPLVLACGDGSTKSLWVGRDCAKTLFGIDMAGELEIAA